MGDFPIFSLGDDDHWLGMPRARALAWTEVLLRRPPSVPGTIMREVWPRLARGIPAGFLDWARRAEIAEAAGFTPGTYEALQSALDGIAPSDHPNHPDNHLDRRGLKPVRPFEVDRWAAWPDAVALGEDPSTATRRLLDHEVRPPLRRPAGELGSTIGLTDLSAVSPVILHVPHAGLAVPASCVRAFCISAEEREREQALLTDLGTDRIAARAGAVSVIASGLSRIVVDVERFEGDAEEMNLVGMGVLYTHGTHGQRIRSLDDGTARPLLEHFRAYGALFGDLVDRTLERHGRAVVLDLHSFPAVRLPYELHRDARRPELCIGVDREHTLEPLLQAVRESFSGWDTSLDEPFAGSYVPLRHLGERRVSSVMLEIRRDRYLDEDGRVDDRDLTGIGRRIRELVDRIRSASPDVP